MRLADRIIILHDALASGGIDHAFGGALALAWCTKAARGTIDIDVNLFLDPESLDQVIAALPPAIVVDEADRAAIERDGQTRLWWDDTPVDVFFNTTPFHQAVATRVRWDELAGRSLPFLSCRDLAVFKAFFDRTKDWADLEAMAEAETLDAEAVLGVLAAYLGGGDQRLERLRSIAGYS